MADQGTTEPLNRICVVGCSGTGKSTLTRQLGAVLDLPVYHLDALLWQPDWVMTDRETEERIQREVATKDQWIIDGNFGSTMSIRFPRAQAIVWLDLPTRTAVWGVLKRLAHHRGRWRPDMAEGCTERFDWDFLKWVLEFREKDRHRIIQRIEAHGSHARLFHITHRRQLPEVIRTLSSLQT